MKTMQDNKEKANSHFVILQDFYVIVVLSVP